MTPAVLMNLGFAATGASDPAPGARPSGADKLLTIAVGCLAGLALLLG